MPIYLSRVLFFTNERGTIATFNYLNEPTLIYLTYIGFNEKEGKVSFIKDTFVITGNIFYKNNLMDNSMGA